MLANAVYFGKWAASSGESVMPSRIRDLLSIGPDRVLEIVGGPTLAAVELQGKERSEGIGFWDPRRLFYFQVPVNMLSAEHSTECVWVLIARQECGAVLKAFDASFFCGPFRQNSVAFKFLRAPGELRVARDVHMRFTAFARALDSVPEESLSSREKLSLRSNFITEMLRNKGGRGVHHKPGYNELILGLVKALAQIPEARLPLSAREGVYWEIIKMIFFGDPPLTFTQIQEVTKRFIQFVHALDHIPHQTITRIDPLRFDLISLLKEILFITNNWPFGQRGWGQVPLPQLPSSEAPPPFHELYWKRFSRKGRGEGVLPRTITVVLRRNPQGGQFDPQYTITHAYVHFNRGGEGTVGAGAKNKVKLIWDVVSGTWETCRQFNRFTGSEALVFFREVLLVHRLDPLFVARPTMAGVYNKKGGWECAWMISPLGSSSLEQYRPKSELERLRLARGVVDCIIHIHSRGVVHKDIKPGNILIYPDGSVRLTDFEWGNGPDVRDVEGGTLLFMYPFECSRATSHDLWALGITLWELLEARLPRSGSTPVYSAKQYEDQTLRHCSQRGKERALPMKEMWGQKVVVLEDIGRNFIQLGFVPPSDRASKEHLVYSLLQPQEERMATLEMVREGLDRLIAREVVSASSA